MVGGFVRGGSDGWRGEGRAVFGLHSKLAQFSLGVEQWDAEAQGAGSAACVFGGGGGRSLMTHTLCVGEFHGRRVPRPLRSVCVQSVNITPTPLTHPPSHPPLTHPPSHQHPSHIHHHTNTPHTSTITPTPLTHPPSHQHPSHIHHHTNTPHTSTITPTPLTHPPSHQHPSHPPSHQHPSHIHHHTNTPHTSTITYPTFPTLVSLHLHWPDSDCCLWQKQASDKLYIKAPAWPHPCLHHWPHPFLHHWPHPCLHHWPHPFQPHWPHPLLPHWPHPFLPHWPHPFFTGPTSPHWPHPFLPHWPHPFLPHWPHPFLPHWPHPFLPHRFDTSRRLPHALHQLFGQGGISGGGGRSGDDLLTVVHKHKLGGVAHPHPPQHNLHSRGQPRRGLNGEASRIEELPFFEDVLNAWICGPVAVPCHDGIETTGTEDD